MRNFLIYWLPVFAWMGFLFPANDALSANSTSYFIVPILKWFLPHADQETITTLHVLIRKCGHFGGYGILAFLLFRGFRGMDRKIWKIKWVIYSGIIAASYGMLDEYLQIFISTRTGSLYDWMIDSTGVIFTLGIIYLKRVKR